MMTDTGPEKKDAPGDTRGARAETRGSLFSHEDVCKAGTDFGENVPVHKYTTDSTVPSTTLKNFVAPQELTLADARQAAYELVNLGLYVIPNKVGDNKAFLREWQNLRINTPDMVDQYWDQPYNVGILPGPSGLLALDVDSPTYHTGDGFTVLAMMQAQYGPLPKTWTAITPHEGNQYYFRCNDPDIGGFELEGDYLGLDIRRASGQITAPGSYRDGKFYTWVPGFSPEETPLADAPKWLVEFLRKRPDKPPKPQRTYHPVAIPTGADNRTLYSTADLIDAINHHLAPPTKYTRTDCVRIFSSMKAAGLPMSVAQAWGKTGSKYKESDWPRIWDGLQEERSDPGALINVLKENGWNPPRLYPELPPPPDDCDAPPEHREQTAWHIDDPPGSPNDPVPADAGTEKQESPPTAWPPIVPIAPLLPKPHPMPIDTFPSMVCAFVTAASIFLQVDPSIIGLLLLGLTAAAVQRRYQVQLFGGPKPTGAFILISAATGVRKSAALSLLRKPFDKYEREMQLIQKSELQTWKDTLKIDTTRKNALSKQATACKPAERAQLLAEIQTLNEQIEEHERHKPPIFRLFADDVTDEMQVKLMEQTGGSLTVLSSEAGLLERLAKGRYDNLPNLDPYLKGYSGESIQIDRKNSESNYVRDARLSLVLATQPSVLQMAIQNQTFASRGLLPRFWFCAADDSNVGFRDIDPPDIPQNLAAFYDGLVRKLVTDTDQGTLFMDPEALRAYQSFRRDAEAERQPGGVLRDDYIAGWGARLDEHCGRIAAQLHVLSCYESGLVPSTTPISLQTVEDAILLTKGFLLPQAISVYAPVQAHPSAVRARELLTRLVRVVQPDSEGNRTISLRDLKRKCKAKDMQAHLIDSLSDLGTAGYIRMTETMPPGGGTKTVIITIRPDLPTNPQTIRNMQL